MWEEPGGGLAAVRIIVGLLFFAHGADMLAAGKQRTIDFFADYKVPMAPIVAPLAGVAQFLSGLAMILGFGAQIGAIVCIAIMVGAIAFIHGKYGFPNINILGQNPDGTRLMGMPGYEFNVALIAGLLAVAIGGPGAWAIA